jgi:hypothetical protein
MRGFVRSPAVAFRDALPLRLRCKKWLHLYCGAKNPRTLVGLGASPSGFGRGLFVVVFCIQMHRPY